MSHSPAHWRSKRILAKDGIKLKTLVASPSTNSRLPRIEYEVNGSTLAPNTSSPRSVRLTYTCTVPDTATVPEQGLTASVTAACSGEVVTGICTPAVSEMSEDHPAGQLSVLSVAIFPCEVRTPVTLPPLISMPVISV